MSSTGLIHDLASGLARLPHAPIVVGFSGGLDSTVLLHALASLESARTRGLRAVHVDHGLHADSSRWSAHCAEFCAALAVDFIGAAATVTPAERGIEAAARDARYAVFSAQLREGAIL